MASSSSIMAAQRMPLACNLPTRARSSNIAKQLSGYQSKRIVVCSAGQRPEAQDAVVKHGTKLAITGLLAAAYMGMTPAGAFAEGPGKLDTDTYKAGAGATIEYSDITNESASEVVRKLADEVLPEVKAKLAKAADEDGGNYSASVVKELETVEKEIDALVSQVKKGGDTSDVKSLASGVEQQINALKAILGFD